MFLITPNPNKETITENNICVVKNPDEVEYYINQCVHNNTSHTACVWKMQEEHIGKYKDFTISAFVHTEKGEVLPK